MTRMFSTKRVALLALMGALAAGLVLLVPAVGGAKTAKQQKVYKFVLSNNFLGNDWRPQMEQLASLTAALEPFKSKISLQIVNSQTTTEAQIADLNNIVASKPDAILVDAGSATALNPTLKRACAAGIVVVSFDQPVTEPCAWRVLQDHGVGQRYVGQWMAKTLHGKGGLFVDRGLPGAPISAVIHDNFLKGVKQYGPNIKVLAEFDGKYSLGPTQQAVSSLLAGHPDVAGVFSQGYCNAVFNAFKQAGKKFVPTTCYGYNGELVACAQKNVPCAILSGAPIVIQQALELALNAVEHKPTPPKNKDVPVAWTVYVTGPAVSLAGNPAAQGGSIQKVVIGKNAFANLAPGLALPWTLPKYHITAQQAAAKRK
jgi:ribose transport system substrate-binding protein